MITSALPGFFNKTIQERQEIIKNMFGLTDQEAAVIKTSDHSLTLLKADTMIENCVAMHSTPIGIATNFIIDGKEILVPMANEEPSVIAGASLAAKLARNGGGFKTQSGRNICKGQVIVIPPSTEEDPITKVMEIKEKIIEVSNSTMPSMVERTGGTQDATARIVNTAHNRMLVVELHIDVGDAMGANCVNHACEVVEQYISENLHYTPLMGILTNLANERIIHAEARWPIASLTTKDFPGADVARRIILAADFAASDPSRGATHRKGIMNGITAVVLATGNDTRAVEAAVHSYASTCENQALTKYYIDNDVLVGEIDVPLPVGVVGGSMRRDPANPIIKKMLRVESANDLARVIASVGLASNFAALRALVTTGINSGHMKLHSRNIAHEAGAHGEEIDTVAAELNNGQPVTVTRARHILERMRSSPIP